jgi:hypothetical protein
MYKLFILSFLLFPAIAFAHGSHEQVGGTWLHGVIHSTYGMFNFTFAVMFFVGVVYVALKKVRLP